MQQGIHLDDKETKQRALFNTVLIQENLNEENSSQNGDNNTQDVLVHYIIKGKYKNNACLIFKLIVLKKVSSKEYSRTNN